jgi:hydrogenase maturation protease
MEHRRPILILGIGNILLKDEGIGVRIIEAMQKMEIPPDIELCDGGTAGADLVDLIADRRKVIIVDAADADVPPGTMVKMRPEDLARPEDAEISLHDFALAQTLFMTEQLKCTPKETVILGIRPFEINYGTELSPGLAGLIDSYIRAILSEARIGL